MQIRKSNRLRGYDYSHDNLYFVTSCVHNMICCFGEVVCTDSFRNRSVPDVFIQDVPHMILNKNGKIAEKQWEWLQEQYPYVILHAFVVMPNHIHGIIEINRMRIQRTGHLDVFSNKIKTLSELMGAYKTTVSKQIHLNGYPEFAWKRSFYENIIRNQLAYYKISDYIANNPARWYNDRFYKKLSRS